MGCPYSLFCVSVSNVCSIQCEKIMKPYIDLRWDAMAWWSALPIEYKHECMPYSGRTTNSLTGLEIQHLFCLAMKKKFADKVLKILATDMPHPDKVAHIAGAAYDMRLAEINKEGEFEIL